MSTSTSCACSGTSPASCAAMRPLWSPRNERPSETMGAEEEEAAVDMLMW